jgi:hypothetical protein
VPAIEGVPTGVTAFVGDTVAVATAAKQFRANGGTRAIEVAAPRPFDFARLLDGMTFDLLCIAPAADGSDVTPETWARAAAYCVGRRAFSSSTRRGRGMSMRREMGPNRSESSVLPLATRRCTSLGSWWTRNRCRRVRWSLA